MQRELVVKGRGVGGTSDLTLLAPLKPGFVDSFESVSYKTRTKKVLDTLHRTRANSHEYKWARLISDSVERVGTIHSVRVAVLEPENKVLLAVTFDGSRESYIRVLWDKVGTLLDLIFCGTIDYVTAWDHSFEEWVEWAHCVQVETGFFYGATQTTARDLLFDRRLALMRGEEKPDLNQAEVDELRAVLPVPEEVIERLIYPLYPVPADEPDVRQRPRPIGYVKALGEQAMLGLQGLASVYRLVELFRPGTRDGDVLRRSAIDLLEEFVEMANGGAINIELAAAEARFSRELRWLIPIPGVRVANDRSRPTLPENRAPRTPSADIQGGILRQYENVTNGVLVLVGFESVDEASRFVAWVASNVTRETDEHDAARATKPFFNIAFTFAGLRALGLEESDLEFFPEEFRQGMAARAGSLGDVRNNHPQRWRLPKRFTTIDHDPASEAVEIDAVHAILQIRCKASGAAADAFSLQDANHPLRALVAEVARQLETGSILAVQPLIRRLEQRRGALTAVENFGFADGNGQPDLEPRKPPFRRNHVPPGEIVLGYDNVADPAPDVSAPDARWLHDGSFFVVRKYRQFVDQLRGAVLETAKDMESRLGGVASDYIELVYAKLMGRWRDGEPIVAPGATGFNVFTYDNDPQGSVCPLHSHIRRANPRSGERQRTDPRKSGRFPRIMRRSMSYGPPPGTVAGGDRGLVFMAYNASLGEQFEVVQRWLTGGNSTGSTSAIGCPIVGVAQSGLDRNFTFEHAGQAFRLRLDAGNVLFDEPMSPTQLEWGLYLFAPGMAVLRRLQATATAPAASRSMPWSLGAGRSRLAELLRMDAVESPEVAVAAWKEAIEDPESIDRLTSASLWAAIRADHAGLLRTTYGVLVADRSLVGDVFLDPHARYSVCGQFDRMKRSFGEISLGLDAGPRYERESASINAAIGALTEDDAFDLAVEAASKKIDAIRDDARVQAQRRGDSTVEVGFDAREILDEVLAALSQAWFGLSDDPGRRFRKGGADWSWTHGQAPWYPGHFTAMSRYMFQPHPNATVIDFGERYGQALRESMRLFVGDHRARGTKPQAPHGGDAPIAAAAFDHADYGLDDDFVARTMVGVLMGFNPTIIGAVLNVLREWHRDGSFGSLRLRFAGSTAASRRQLVLDATRRSAKARPMPQLAWRTVVRPHRLGPSDAAGLDLKAGDLVVLAIASATQQSLADGQSDGRAMFGGDRSTLPHPTHACPGYAPAIGAMHGTLVALLSRSENLKTGPAPLTFTLEAALPTTPPVTPPAIQALFEPTFATRLRNVAEQRERLLARGSKRTAQKLVMGWGDSWIAFPFLPPWLFADLLDQLKTKARDIDKEYCSVRDWSTLKSMAQKTAGFCFHLQEKLDEGLDVTVLLSGGGNDSTGAVLSSILNDVGTTPTINPQALSDHLYGAGGVGGLKGDYEIIIGEIRKVSSQVKIVVHGYDYPLPQGKGIYARSWLLEPFEQHHYAWPRDETVMTQAMRYLIDELNKMVEGLSGVTYVKLSETVETAWPNNVEDHWFDDLHPTEDAFALMAAKVAKVL